MGRASPFETPAGDRAAADALLRGQLASGDDSIFRNSREAASHGDGPIILVVRSDAVGLDLTQSRCQLFAADIERADSDRFPVQFLDKFLQGLVLFILIRQIRPVHEWCRGGWKISRITLHGLMQDVAAAQARQRFHKQP